MGRADYRKSFPGRDLTATVPDSVYVDSANNRMFRPHRFQAPRNLHRESQNANVTCNMQRTSFKNMECPAARALERVGEWWSILILRDAFHGLSRFDEFQASLGIAPNILTRRLKQLTENGLLARHRYSERPPRYEYRLTAQGRDFFPVLAALLAWGNRNLTPEGISVHLADRDSGQVLEPILVDQSTGKPITPDNVRLQPGPAASSQVRARAARIKARHSTGPLQDRDGET